MEKYVLLAALAGVVLVVISAIILAFRVCIMDMRERSAPSGDWENEDFVEGGNNGYSLYVGNAPLTTPQYYELLTGRLQAFTEAHPDLEILEVKARLFHGHLYVTMHAMPREAEVAQL